MDTIFALATAQGKAGVAVIRISGPHAHTSALRFSGSLPSPRQSGLRHLRDGEGDVLDHALVLRFDAPDSFTGEDIVEFHLHGSVAVISRTLLVLSKDPDLRLAEPGEFTRRALENGKLDLTQVEGLADLIDAETEVQRKQAQKTLAGALGKLADEWRRNLIRAASLIEVVIDFADEDVPTDVSPEVDTLLAAVQSNLEREIAGAKIAERVRIGFEVAIVGEPNAGKSTLLNALAGREAAITSEYAGTTRDIIEVRMDIDGLPVTLLDTAGLRDTDDAVETIGVNRARERAEQADLRVFLTDDVPGLQLSKKDGDIVKSPKADLSGNLVGSVSGKTGFGMDVLVEEIGSVLSQRAMKASLASHLRHKEALERASFAIEAARDLLLEGSDHYDLVAENIRTASRALEFLVGRVDVESLLDEIFASFCLGK